MILFIILALVLLLLSLFMVAVASIGGTIGIVIFSDIIVCAFIIIGIMKRIALKKKR
ncbi:MAG: hypothetical protein NC548_65660 [Lachnospiraceae bacterium]|nr:hypothetical protein [Lachnospiraceae bacterium]